MSLSADEVVKLIEQDPNRLKSLTPEDPISVWYRENLKTVCMEKVIKISGIDDESMLISLASYKSQARRNAWLDKLINDHSLNDVADALEFDTVEQFQEWRSENTEIDELDMSMLETSFGYM